MVHWTKIWRGWCRVAGANGARAMALGAFQWLPPPSAPMACNSHPLSTWPMKKMTKKKNKIQIQKQNTNANTKYNVIHLPRATDRWSPEVKNWLGVKSKEGRVCVDYKIQRQRQRQECNKETIVLSFQCIAQFRNCLISKKFPMNLNRSFRQVTMPLFRYIATFFR